jgi:hypothetical protein
MTNENLSRHLDLRHSPPNLPGPVLGPLASAGLVSALRAWHLHCHQSTPANHTHGAP